MGEANGIDSMELSSGMEPAHEITPVENGTSAPSTDSVSAPSQPMETDINKAVVEPVTNGNAVAASAPTETVAPTPAPPVRPALPPAPGSISSGLNIPMPLLQQFGEVFVGPGAEKEASLIGLGLKKLRTRDKDRLHDAKRQAMDVSIKTIMLRQQQTHQQNQQKQQMYAQALSLMARVYIGSISFEVREDMLKKAMEPFGPIKSLNMSWDAATGHHKGFAFLEYEVPEAAVLAQEAMNGLLMGGRNLKVLPTRLYTPQVGRPSNMPQAQPIIEMVQQESKKYFRVYVASVHPDLSENDVKSVFEAFGEVVSCKLARQGISGKGGHRGFGYIEFDNANSMNEAISGMNMFDLGGQFLRVGRCITPPEALNYIVPQTPSALPQSAAVALAAVTARVQALEATQSPKAGSSSPGSASPARAASPALPPPPHVNVPSPALTPPLPAVPAVAEPPAPAVIQPPPIATPSPPPLPVSHQEPPVLPQQSAAPPPPPPVPPVGQFSVPQIPPPAVVIPPPAVVVPPPAVVVPPPSVVVPPPTVVVPPPSVVIPPPGLAQIPPPSVVAPPKLATPISQASTSAGGTAQSLIDRIKLDRIKNKYKQASGGQASFAPLDEKYRPKDALAGNDEESGEQLAITGGSSKKSNDIQSLALALIEGGGAVATLKRRAEQEAAIKEATKKKRKIKPPKAKGPQLTTEAALAAAEKAGAMNDALIEKEVNSEEATLASQEGLEIRGNESRHLLMTKLMRITRSSVLLLKNMVGPEEIDEYLEGEVKEECSKYGHVEEVLIVNDEANAIVKIFVRFLDPKQVDEAKKALDGRFFAGRTISAVVYDQAMYDHGDYSA